MKILIIIGIVVFIMILILTFIIISKRKMKREILKIEEADNNIDLYLEKSKELLEQISKFLKDEELELFSKDSFDNLNHIKKWELLKRYYGKVKELLELEEEINDDNKFNDLLNEVVDNDCNLNGSIKFYNDSVSKYQSLKKKVPARFVKVLCGFKKFETYNIKTSKNLF